MKANQLTAVVAYCTVMQVAELYPFCEFTALFVVSSTGMIELDVKSLSMPTRKGENDVENRPKRKYNAHS